VNAIKRGNRVVIVNNASLGGTGWQAEKNRPNNGAAYLTEQLAAFGKTGRLAHPELEKKGFTLAFLQTYAKDIARLVKVVDIDSPNAISEAARHLSGSGPLP